MSEKRNIFDRLALGCITYLESFPECRSIAFQGNDAVPSTEVLLWERKHCKLPSDLKAFYSIFNGFNLSWSIEIGDRVETIGEMRLHKLDNIARCTTEFFVHERLPEDQCISAPSPKTCNLFVLDSSCTLGDIVLLYRINSILVSSPTASGSTISSQSFSDEPEVWLLDNSARLSYIAKSFTHYLRLMVVHLGIQGWQAVFTDSWTPTTQHWMNLFCKERLLVDRHYRHELQYGNK
jgi:tubulin polyglutamylase complex subunit 2